MKIILIFLAVVIPALAELELELTRLSRNSEKLAVGKNQCQDPATIGNETKYQEICIEKDIGYSVELYKHPTTFRLALDLTTPISWIKGQSCKITGSSQKCSLIESNLGQRIDNALKRKVTELIKKLKMKIVDDQSDQAIIEGSNEIVMGSPEKLINTTITAKNNDHTSNLFDVLMLGLYIIGDKDVITLNETTFIRAHEISPNLNELCDGAISLRFDQNSENSFLTQLFGYLKSKKKIISIYLGDHVKVATVGSYSAKFIKNGISSLKRIKIEQDQKHGKMPQIQGIILEGSHVEDNAMEDNSSAVFSLSSSFLGLPRSTLQNFIAKFIGKQNSCTITPFLECTFHSKKDLQSFQSSTLNFDFDTSIVGFVIRDLILRKEGKKVKFNIKQSLSNFTVLGQPFFMKYYVYFDYDNGEIGFAERALSVQESFIEMVTLIHLVVLLILFVICFVLSSEKCRRLYFEVFQRIMQKAGPSVSQIREKYRPVRGEGVEEVKEAKSPSLGQDIEGI